LLLVGEADRATAGTYPSRQRRCAGTYPFC